MTITLAPHTEARLREQAAREGRDPAALAGVLLDGLLGADELISVTDAVNHALHAAEQGREKPLAVYLAEQRQKRGYGEEWPRPHSVTETAPGVFNAASE